jgi:protein TonB
MRRLLGVCAAFMLSGGMHLAGSGVFAPERVEMPGGGDPAPARLGSSFADMVAGTPGTVRPVMAENVRPDDATAPVTPTEPASAHLPHVADNAAALRADGAEEPAGVEQTRPAEAVVARHASAAPSAQTARETAVSVASLATSSSVSAAPSPNTVTASRDTPDEVARSEPTRTASVLPKETVSAVEQDGPAPRTSPRPPERPEGARDMPRPDPQPRVADAPQSQARTTGNAAFDAALGRAEGSEEGTAAASAQRRTDSSPAADPAEVANYPGEVLRRIARQGRPRVRHDGADAVIAFTVDARGALASLAVARSSGNPSLDEAGLTILRRAAPFPPPPRGAQTRFSIAFGGRR